MFIYLDSKGFNLHVPTQLSLSIPLNMVQHDCNQCTKSISINN